ncbi:MULTISPECIES: hypothetical protein [Geobacillus]|uniref:hypothetical protein n=1 Tax=Geobacillus TaxID=129337 RepID=UPI000519C129|nr:MULTISPECIES: hypothetical protein [Geobacillus]KQC46950.1 hypothetical protein AP057_08980 [Geobacillus sp. Sah69]MED4333330.1 hypothetical protein [Geobacillus stearothermophilus]MED4995877.1 hypothetical protein [Geobacillus stearothermophilus]
MTVLDIVKAKLDNPPSDDRLAMYIEEVGQAIKTFCNRDDIPEELQYVHANMVVDLIRLEQKSAPESEPAVKSIKEGDVQVTFDTPEKSQGEKITEAILHSYQAQLYRYRKMRW